MAKVFPGAGFSVLSAFCPEQKKRCEIEAKTETETASETEQRNPLVFSKRQHNGAKSPDKILFYTCHVMNDGMGDIANFKDISGLHATFQMKYKDKYQDIVPCYLITCPVKFSKQALELLQGYGLNVDSPYFHFIPYEDKSVAHHRKVFSEYLEKSPTLKSQLKNTVGILNISTDEMDLHTSKSEIQNASYLEVMKLPPRIGFQLRLFFKEINRMIPCFTIGEMGTTTIPVDIIRAYPECYFNLGFAENEYGYIPQTLTQEPGQDFSAACTNTFLLQRVLESIDPANKERLLNGMESFKQKVLMVPAYWQGGAELCLSFLNVVVNASVTFPYEEILIFANFEKENNIFDELEKVKSRISSKIHSITVFNNDDADPKRGQKTIVLSQDSETKTRKEKEPDSCAFSEHNKPVSVKIFLGWLPEKFRTFLCFHAQLFAGGSGDKTFEALLSFKNVPLMQIKDYKSQFWQAFMARVSDILDKKLSKGEKNCVTPYLQSLLDISDDHLAIKNATKFDKSRLPFHYASLEKDEENAARCITKEFLAQWQLVLQELHQNFNFKDKFPGILESLLKIAPTDYTSYEPYSRHISYLICI